MAQEEEDVRDYSLMEEQKAIKKTGTLQSIKACMSGSHGFCPVTCMRICSGESI